MNRFIFAFCGLFLWSWSGYALQAQTSAGPYRTYLNARFGYSIAYPYKLLKPQGEAENGDGQAFRSADGQVELLVYGSLNALGQKLSEVYAEEVANRSQEGSEVTYKVLRASYFVVSGRFAGNRIFYRKTFYKRAEDSFVSFSLEYPAKASMTYNSVTTRIAQSFKP
jgi:hypothetical protein